MKKSDRLDIQIEQNSYSEGDPHQRDDFRSGDRSEFRSDFRSDFRGGFRGGFRGDFSYGDSRLEHFFWWILNITLTLVRKYILPFKYFNFLLSFY